MPTINQHCSLTSTKALRQKNAELKYWKKIELLHHHYTFWKSTDSTEKVLELSPTI